MPIWVIILLVILLTGGVGYWGNNTYPGYSGGISIGGIVLVLLVLYLLGFLRR